MHLKAKQYREVVPNIQKEYSVFSGFETMETINILKSVEIF